jgi:hypothetical protein
MQILVFSEKNCCRMSLKSEKALSPVVFVDNALSNIVESYAIFVENFMKVDEFLSFSATSRIDRNESEMNFEQRSYNDLKVFNQSTQFLSVITQISVNILKTISSSIIITS